MRRVRVLLEGNGRQIWLVSVRFQIRPLSAVGLLLQPEALGVRGPETEPRDCAHTFSPRKRFPTTVGRLDEPCGLTQTQCCDHKNENGAGAYQIDDAGCCDLIYFNTGFSMANAMVQVDTGRTGAWLVTSGTGA